jgi:hypothetical protein
MIVNIGAFVGPIFASKLREVSWDLVFIMSAIVIGINLLLVILFFREPPVERKSEPLGKSIVQIFHNIGAALSDLKLLIFLIIIIGFWAMYNQLFYTLPVFIDQWLDTSPIYNSLDSVSPALARAIGTENGTIAPEMLTNIDAFYIVVFQVLVSSLVMRFKPLKTMLAGILICAIGIGLWFVTLNPFFLEYVGRIAPEDKVALYMGCYFIPMAGGNFLAGILSGNVYGSVADKITLLQREVAARGLSIPEISASFSQNEYVAQAADRMGMTPHELTIFLWNTYHPSKIWMIFTGIGLLTVAALSVYNWFLGRNSGKQAY